MEYLKSALALSVGLVLVSGFTSSCGGVSKNSDGDVVAETEATVPLMPLDLPLFPTNLTMGSIKDTIKSSLKGIIDLQGAFKIVSMPKDSVIDGAIANLDKKLTEATGQILQSSTLALSLQDKIKGLDKVDITEVSFDAVLNNRTEDFAAMPARFSLYIGEKSKVDAFDESVRIPFTLVTEESNSSSESSATNIANETSSTGETFVLADKKDVAIKTENLANLAAYLTSIIKGESTDFAINYKLEYGVADTEHGAKPLVFVDKLGKCIAGLSGISIPYLYETDIAKDCPPPQKLISWHVAIKSLQMNVKVSADLFNVGEVPSCSEFANANGLEVLANACGSK